MIRFLHSYNRSFLLLPHCAYSNPFVDSRPIRNAEALMTSNVWSLQCFDSQRIFQRPPSRRSTVSTGARFISGSHVLIDLCACRIDGFIAYWGVDWHVRCRGRVNCIFRVWSHARILEILYYVKVEMVSQAPASLRTERSMRKFLNTGWQSIIAALHNWTIKRRLYYKILSVVMFCLPSQSFQFNIKQLMKLIASSPFGVDLSLCPFHIWNLNSLCLRSAAVIRTM